MPRILLFAILLFAILLFAISLSLILEAEKLIMRRWAARAASGPHAAAMI